MRRLGSLKIFGGPLGVQHAGMTRPFFFAVLSSSHVCPWLLLAPLQRLSISKIPTSGLPSVFVWHYHAGYADLDHRG